MHVYLDAAANTKRCNFLRLFPSVEFDGHSHSAANTRSGNSCAGMDANSLSGTDSSDDNANGESDPNSLVGSDENSEGHSDALSDISEDDDLFRCSAHPAGPSELRFLF